jgi:hexosaminidase
MEYKKHPEINEGWIEYCKQMYEYSGKSEEIQGYTYPWKKNSIHSENGEGGFLTQEQVKEIIDHCADRRIEIIPEVPSLSHCDYLLTRHPELRERRTDEYADTYCPSNPASYDLLFDVFDEIIELFKPGEINIGHDEAYSIGNCEKCKGKDPVKLYTGDIIKIKDYLAGYNVKTMMWAEKLIDARLPDGRPCGGANVTVDYDFDRKTFIEEAVIPALYPCADVLPNDIIMFHWYWGIDENYDEIYHKRGFPLIYGNYNPVKFKNWRSRIERGVKGAIISNWSTAKKENLQRNNMLYNLAYSNLLFWEDDYTDDLIPGFEQAAFEMLYDYNYAHVKHGVKILHTTDFGLPYKQFYDGHFIVREEYDLGYYLVEYNDGTKIKIPVEYGMNISSSENKWDISEQKLPEVAASTLPWIVKSCCGNNYTAYEFIFETGAKKAIKSIGHVPNPKINASVEILKFEVF